MMNIVLALLLWGNPPYSEMVCTWTRYPAGCQMCCSNEDDTPSDYKLTVCKMLPINKCLGEEKK